jgi:hypothetical protein
LVGPPRFELGTSCSPSRRSAVRARDRPPPVFSVRYDVRSATTPRIWQGAIHNPTVRQNNLVGILVKRVAPVGLKRRRVSTGAIPAGPWRTEQVHLSVASLLTRPSPYLRRVGVHDFTFEACSSLTHVSACQFARPPVVALLRGFDPTSHPIESLVSHQVLPRTTWVGRTSDLRRWGELRQRAKGTNTLFTPDKKRWRSRTRFRILDLSAARHLQPEASLARIVVEHPNRFQREFIQVFAEQRKLRQQVRRNRDDVAPDGVGLNDIQKFSGAGPN